MCQIKLLGPIKKSLPNYKAQNYFVLSQEEYGLTIAEILAARNIEITKYYLLYVEHKQVSLDYVLKENENLVVVPILAGG